MVVIQREKPPTFATRVKDGIFIGTVHAALDPGFIFTNKITHIVNCAGANVMNRRAGFGLRHPRGRPARRSIRFRANGTCSLIAVAGSA